MSELERVTGLVRKFVKDRDWSRFHSFKNLSMSLALEAAEVMEHFQWKSREEEVEHLKKHKRELAEELADVQIYLIEMADKAEVDLFEEVEKKLVKASEKYPVAKFTGKHSNKFDRK